MMKMETVRVWILAGLTLLLSLAPGRVMAQGGPSALRVSLSPGLALAGGTELGSGVGGVAQLAVERGHHRISLRFATIADVTGFPDGSGDGHLSEMGILYGRRGGGPGPGQSVSAGVSAVRFEECPEEPQGSFYDDPGCTTVGIPLVAEVGFGTSVVGLALQLFGNLNSRAPFAGVAVTLPLGWMR